MLQTSIDIPLMLFRLGQYILVLFAGYLMWKGLFALIEEETKKKHIHIDGEIDYWSKRVKLLEIKQKYHELKEESEDEDDPEDIEDIEQELNDAEEVEIPTLTELINRDEGDFLKHSQDPPFPSPPVMTSTHVQKAKHWLFWDKGERKNGNNRR